MTRPALLALLVSLVLVACVHAPPPVRVESSSQEVRFVQDVKPILDSRCAVCHSCYNSPCQLKLSSFEGLDRGASKIAVYASERLTAQDPTRLFFDAQSTEGWREKGFHSVLENTAGPGENNSIMLQLLEAKKRHPQSVGSYEPEADDLACVEDGKELGKFLKEHPNRGMPFGFPGLSDDEYDVIAAWLQQGKPGPTPEEQRALTGPSAGAAQAIATWEGFLNTEDAKHALTARYLYEHFFLAHLTFPDAAPLEFYELVRSTTPPGTPIEVIASVRPYDPPGLAHFYYRLRKIHSTIVHKTHMVVELDEARLSRLRDLFIAPEWLEKPHRMQWDSEVDANPFVTFAQIPPRSRYEFMLDHAEYIMRTFIRGPVCKGQIALNVIHDHFWVMFMDPAADLTATDPSFLESQASNLRLPTEKGSNDRLTKVFSNAYRKRYADFYMAKLSLYEKQARGGFGIDAIWKGRRETDAPVQTVYRHFDSASVHKGALGELPRTLWVIDYAQFERIYYALVAGFDVFGNVSHQLNVRRYMDYLRVEGELNFVQFLPREERLATMQSWYVGDDTFHNVDDEDLLKGLDTRVEYLTDHPKQEFVERVVETHIPKEMGIAFDSVNYVRAGAEPPRMPESFATQEDILNGFRALTAPGTGFIRYFNGFKANLVFLRVKNFAGADHVVSIVINRWHDNVNALFKEKSRLDASRDTIDFIYGSVGSYPNYFFDVEAEALPDFFDMMANFDGSDPYREKIFRYGVNRADPRFWETYDWFQRRLNEADPVQAGLYDLNRYYSEAATETTKP